MFNEGRYWERAQAGEFRQVVFWRGRTTPSFEPPGTESQMVRYIDQSGDDVAQVHQYVRPDGSLGGRGHRPDPKRLFQDGAIYLPYPKT
jgi:hypothetical protein